MARYHDQDHLPSHRATPVRANKEIRQTIDSFLQSKHAKVDGLDAKSVDDLTRRFVQTSFENLGRAPWNLSGKELETLLTETLPLRFAGDEPFLNQAPKVFSALFDQIDEIRHIEHREDIDKTLARHSETFAQTVKDVPDERRIPWFEKIETIVSNEPKLRRNDPCPCGSGKKVKACCGTK